MKFRFKIQDYQTDAVNSVVKVFKGQPFCDMVRYTRDLGIRKKSESGQSSLWDADFTAYNDNDDGFENANILLDDETLLANIQKIQQDNNIKVQNELIKHLGRCSLNIEMETGTGKTYVYIKTIFELNERYGWSKFIIVVPSIAIREGVKKSFEMMEEHFMQHYGKKARYFIYDSKNLSKIDAFASANDIQVMIINAQAFNARGADARRIDMALDEFQSRKPIDVIKKNRPIIILDEPQKLGGDATQSRLKDFNPLFCLSYSATHKKENNLVYVLDALDAYNKKLVKKIEVKGFEVKNLRGTDSYLFLEKIVLSKDKPPMARIELEIDYNKSINRETRLIKKDDDLFYISKQMQQYKGYIVTDINPFNNTVTFLNGKTINAGVAQGDISESDLRRIQIRETILSHFEKERKLYRKRIKCLSLFFIDEVAKYRDYSREDEQGEYARIFEEEYNRLLNDYIRLDEPGYSKYLQNIKVADTHKGYFSIDKKSGRMIDSKEKGEEGSDDISAYDLILKNKERLLSFDEPTRFIFSHSALREGWDNPNIFQICTLKHSNSSIAKRQEVGRGLRICVNEMGDRVDKSYPATNFHDVNKLTVIATDSYADFVGGLQKELKDALYNRPTRATVEYFKGKIITDTNGENVAIDSGTAARLYSYLFENKYIEKDGKITENYRANLENESLKELPSDLQPYAKSIQKLVQGVFDESVLKDMVENGNEPEVKNGLNDNFYKKEFQNLWNYINHKYTYTVEFDSEELIKNSINELNNSLYVSELQYVVTTGEQKREMERNQLSRGESFKGYKTRNEKLSFANSSEIKYDLVGKLAGNTTLTRKTIVTILKGLHPDMFEMFKVNPEEFIKKTTKIINEQKASMIVDHIIYNKTDGTYDNDIFTNNQSKIDFRKAFRTKKHIEDFVVTDGVAEDSIEMKFATDLENADEVCVYAKLPRTFQIPTPVGNYSPDWAIAFNDNSGIKHIYFIAETKGSMDSLELRGIEKAKTSCVKKLFNELRLGEKVRYEVVDNYQSLLKVMNSIN